MPASTPSAPLGERFERAAAHAIAAHRHDRRASSDVPYVAHLFATCAIVLERGGSEAEAVAALLHETVDDADAIAGLANVRERFGADVAAIVEAGRGIDVALGSDARPFFDRKRAMFARAGRRDGLGDSAALVIAASGLAEARATRDDLARGVDSFGRMAGKKFGTLWAYRALADALRVRGGRFASFATELVALVDEMAGKRVTANELLAAFAIDDSVGEADRGTLATSEFAS